MSTKLIVGALSVLTICLLLWTNSSAQQSFECNRDCVRQFRSFVKTRSTGFLSSDMEKFNWGLGDKVAIMIRASYNADNLSETETVRALFPIIEDAFSAPNLLPEEYKHPNRTVKLLREVQSHFSQVLIRSDIDGLINSITWGNGTLVQKPD